MDTSRYKHIKDNLTSSAKMKLDHIKRFLVRGNASIMVGSGFSKNADMDDSVQMKDWNALGIDFYKRLYSVESVEGAEINPIRLASQIEASFGRNELEEMIVSSLPDDKVTPGRLHSQLLSLGWKDIFTTNYDTLLERCLPIAKQYNIVTNKSTLLYKTSPRIIKLHGSFKDVRPFIITEEDYRTYQSKFPEFVNTVRQALIEGVLCLIGFSGNDPNFLQWIGWMRDVMGQSAAPVIMFSCDTDIHESELKLYNQRGIDVISLPAIAKGMLLSIEESIEFTFNYLKEQEKKKSWSASLDVKNHIRKIDIASLIEEMSAIRESYPGWIILPKEHYLDFHDNLSLVSYIYKLSVENIDEYIDYMFELDWRYTVSLSIKCMPNYKSALETIVSLQTDKKNCYKVISLAISLLSIYRLEFEEEKSEHLVEFIDGLLNKNKSVTLYNRFQYERILLATSKLDITSANKLLNQWDINSTDYVSALWKSCVYAEIGEQEKALSILDPICSDIRTKLLMESASPFLISCNTVANRAIRFYDAKKRVNFDPDNNNGFDFDGILTYIVAEIQKENNQNGVHYTHDFNIARQYTTRTIGYDDVYSNLIEPYRFILARETVGFPKRLHQTSIESKNYEFIITKLVKKNFKVGISALLGTNLSDGVRHAISRDVLRNVPRQEVEVVFNAIYKNISKGLNIEGECYKAHIGLTVLPLLCRLAVRLSYDKITKLIELYMKHFVSSHIYYKRDDLLTLYQCLPAENYKSVINNIFSTELIVDSYRNDITLPTRTVSGDIKKNTFDVILQGLRSEDNDVANAAYIRLVRIYKLLKESFVKKANSAIRNWRAVLGDVVNKCYSFNLLPAEPEEETIIKLFISKQFNNLEQQNLQQSNIDDASVDSLLNTISSLVPFVRYMSDEQYQDLYNRAMNFLVAKKDSLTGSTRRTISLLFDNDAERVLDSLFSLATTEMARVECVPQNVLSNISDSAKVFCERGVNVRASYALFSHFAKSGTYDNEILREAMKDFDSLDKDIQQDAIEVIMLYAKMGILSQTDINHIFDNLIAAQDIYTSQIIELLIRLTTLSLIEFDESRYTEVLSTLRVKTPKRRLEEEYKTDIYYSALKLAGYLSTLDLEDCDLKEKILEWKLFSQDDSTFNDVRVGYQIGTQLAKVKE